MNAEQKQQAQQAIEGWQSVRNDDPMKPAGDVLAALLQELVDAPEPEPVAWAYEIPVAGGYQTRFSETEPTLLLELNKRPLYDAPTALSMPDEQLQAAFDRGFKAGNEQGIAQQIEIHKLHDLLAAQTN